MKTKTKKNNQPEDSLKKDKINNLILGPSGLVSMFPKEITLGQERSSSRKEIPWSSGIISSPDKAQRRGPRLINLKPIGRWTATLLVILFLAINCQKKAWSPSSDLPPSSQSESLSQVSASSFSHQRQEKTEFSGEKAKVKEDKTLYHCPMHPNYLSDKPGDCPICGMTLVPIEADKEKEATTALPAGTVEISPEKQHLLGVTFGQVERRELHHLISAYGRLAYDETRLATVTTKFSGWIEKLFVNYTGKLVKRGEPIFSIYSPELIAAQEEYLLALRAQQSFSLLQGNFNSRKEKEEEKQVSQNQDRKELMTIEAGLVKLKEDQKKLIEESSGLNLNQSWTNLVEAARRRLLLWDISQDQIERMEKEGKPFRNLTIFSPATGFIVEKNLMEGQFIMAGEKLFSLADLSRLWLLADIYEQDLPFIHVDQEVEVDIASFPNENLRGRISYIYPYLEKENRTVKVRIEFPNPGYKLKPELYGRLKIHLRLGEKLSIAEEAIIDTGERKIVFVVHEGRHFEPREVKLGLKAGYYYEVLDGLDEGEQIVTSAQFLIDSESRLKMAMEGLHRHPQAKKPEKKEEKTPPSPKHIH